MLGKPVEIAVVSAKIGKMVHVNILTMRVVVQNMCASVQVAIIRAGEVQWKE